MFGKWTVAVIVVPYRHAMNAEEGWKKWIKKYVQCIEYAYRI